MKKVISVLVVVVMVAAMVSLVFAADKKKGTIKSVDAKAGSLVLAVDGGKDETLKADKAVDLGKLKAGDKVEVSIEKGVVKTLAVGDAAPAAKPKPKAAVGC